MNNLKCVAISDNHGHLLDIPECDILLIGGDICPVWNHDLFYQRRWLDNDFRLWLEKIPAKKVVGIAGNHDFIFERLPHLIPENLRWTYLQDSSIEWEGYNIYGSPWQTGLARWAFYARNEKAIILRDKIPSQTDILITHEPPFGHGDFLQNGEKVGCKFLKEKIEKNNFLVNITGHIHESRGKFKLKNTTVLNVASLDVTYKKLQPVVTFELCRKNQQTNVDSSQNTLINLSLKVNS